MLKLRADIFAESLQCAVVNWIHKISYSWMKSLFSDYIQFQALTVVNKKVYIPPALEALFHNANVWVKVLILLFT